MLAVVCDVKPVPVRCIDDGPLIARGGCVAGGDRQGGQARLERKLASPAESFPWSRI